MKMFEVVLMVPLRHDGSRYVYYSNVGLRRLYLLMMDISREIRSLSCFLHGIGNVSRGDCCLLVGLGER